MGIVTDAIIQNDLQTLKYLLSKNYIHDYDIEKFVSLAAEEEKPKILSFFYKHYKEKFDSDCVESIFYHACEYNNIHVIEWIINRKLEKQLRNHKIMEAIDEAAANDCLDVLKYIYDIPDKIDFLYKDAIDYASSCGNVDVLQWFKDNDFFTDSVDPRTDEPRPAYSTRAFNDAASEGHLDVLKWWYDSGLELKYDYEALEMAEYNEHDDVVKWLLEYIFNKPVFDVANMKKSNECFNDVCIICKDPDVHDLICLPCKHAGCTICYEKWYEANCKKCILCQKIFDVNHCTLLSS